MSQVFSADSVMIPLPVTLPTTGETVGVTGNFLNPPFQNAKAVVMANVVVTAGAGTTSLAVRIRRNPAGENLQVTGSGALTAVAGNQYSLSIQGADAIPDGRAVQYAVTVLAGGATGTGTIVSGNVSTILISG